MGHRSPGIVIKVMGSCSGFGGGGVSEGSRRKDQPTWGWRVERMGVGRHVPLAKLSRSNMASALRGTTGAEVRQRAAALGQQLRAEDGVATAVRTTEQLCAARVGGQFRPEAAPLEPWARGTPKGRHATGRAGPCDVSESGRRCLEGGHRTAALASPGVLVVDFP